ncbi:MAG: YggT family protein [Cyanobacteriota bacterium]|jgi:YggT family protein|nr:YggT family protein [Cyanobacteriota bacterium]
MASPGLLSGVHLALALGLAAWTLMFLARLVLTWYPQMDPNQGKLRWLGLLTEPLLAPTRALIQPIGGVDVSPVIWVGLVSLARELLVGQQGLLSQVLRQAQLASLN